MAYYFLAASLPTLVLDEPLPVTEDEFLQTCEDNMDPPDFEDVRRIIKGEPEKARHPFVVEWLCRETLLRNAVTRTRAARLGIEPGPFLKYCEFYESYPDEAVAEIMRGESESRQGASTPLDRELALDGFRWDMIDEMAVFEPFGAESVLAFALKFNIARRWAGLEEEKGRSRVDDFIQKAFEDV